MHLIPNSGHNKVHTRRQTQARSSGLRNCHLYRTSIVSRGKNWSRDHGSWRSVNRSLDGHSLVSDSDRMAGGRYQQRCVRIQRLLDQIRTCHQSLHNSRAVWPSCSIRHRLEHIVTIFHARRPTCVYSLVRYACVSPV